MLKPSMTRLTAVILSMVMAMPPGMTPAQAKEPLPAVLAGPVSSLAALLSDGYAEEFKEARTWHAVDLDSHGPRDAIVLFTLEGEARTNDYGFYMAVFEGMELNDPSLNEPARYRLIAFTQVGGKGWRHVDFDHVRGSVLNVDIVYLCQNNGRHFPTRRRPLWF
jgi:hypothetical protein